MSQRYTVLFEDIAPVMDAGKWNACSKGYLSMSESVLNEIEFGAYFWLMSFGILSWGGGGKRINRLSNIVWPQ